MPLPAIMPQIDTPEVIRTEGPRAACNGGGGALGHPRVFLSFGPDGRVVCPYCSRVYEQVAGDSGHH
jgi:uncharacterized Zn-finger protein